MRYDEVMSTKAQKLDIEMLRAELIKKVHTISNVGTDAEFYNNESKRLLGQAVETQNQVEEDIEQMVSR
jgi:spore germination protein YaaH